MIQDHSVKVLGIEPTVLSVGIESDGWEQCFYGVRSKETVDDCAIILGMLR